MRFDPSGAMEKIPAGTAAKKISFPVGDQSGKTSSSEPSRRGASPEPSAPIFQRSKFVPFRENANWAPSGDQVGHESVPSVVSRIGSVPSAATTQMPLPPSAKAIRVPTGEN